jgi:hypothetical protein
MAPKRLLLFQSSNPHHLTLDVEGKQSQQQPRSQPRSAEASSQMDLMDERETSALET